MNLNSIIRHLLRDKESLSQYHKGSRVTFEDIKRRMLGLERWEEWYLPDHHYRLLASKSFEKINSIADTLTEGVYRLTIDLLDIDSNQISIKPNGYNIWQDMIASMPPLLLQSAYIWKTQKVDWSDNKAVEALLIQIIAPNFRYTALPSLKNSPLNTFSSDKGGFHDLHMHLNGATEVDVLWQDYLAFPDKVYNELAIGWKNEKVRELFEQETTLLTPLRFRNLLIVARKLRNLLFQLIDGQIPISPKRSIEKQLQNLTNEYSASISDSFQNPFASLVRGSFSPLAIEAMMYVRIMDHISHNPKDGSAELFHFYLLILGLCNRLLVQQTNQYGFEQFQKLTLSGLREYTESKYIDRFRQIRGNKLQHLSFLEGRFSPKASEKELTEMINLVDSGWKSMMGTNILTGQASLKLVAHFIKKSEGKSVDSKIRHRALRIDLWKRATVLSLLIKKYPKYKALITGVDAASSEFDAPPEVFAPIYRFLRREVGHFTFHAGEDFHHLISGIRAIYEVINFTDMKSGDRIGHAVALGLSPIQWTKAVGKRLLIAQGEWLDNLLFVYYLSEQREGSLLKYLQPILISKIEETAFKVYQKEYDIENLIVSWQYRKYEPMLLLTKEREQATYLEVFDQDQWSEVQQLDINVQVKEIITRYHDKDFRKYYENIMPIDSNSVFGTKGMLLCQRILLKLMSDRNIIIETLPTSNIRIGHHHSFQTYHLWNWLKWDTLDKNVPPIVLGTDDTGIFATNIFNEYANIYHHLNYFRKQSKSAAMETIIMLEANSEKWRFNEY